MNNFGSRVVVCQISTVRGEMEEDIGSSLRRPTPRPGTSVSPAPTRVTKDQILPLLSQPARLRNICILAHVDHGKTTLSDSFIASNGIISRRQAGKLRYLDSRDDEQARGITMESSAISLLYGRAPGDTFLVNLIDSPGHVDFCGQVVTATQLCDGALVILDVIEGICTQTLAVLRQAKRENLHTILILNKLDRLKTELKMTPGEATAYLHHLLGQMNETIRTQFNSKWNYDPSTGNVLFASATDGWAFGVHELTRFYANQKGMQIVPEQWWGEGFTWDPKDKCMIARSGNRPSVFAQLAIDPIWRIYDLDLVDTPGINKVCKGLGVTLLRRESIKDNRQLQNSIVSTWLPLADCIFSALVDHLPDPLFASPHYNNNMEESETTELEMSLQGLSISEKEVLVYVSKLFVGDGKLLGMARCFTGTLRVGDTVKVLLPKHSGKVGEEPPQEYVVEELFLLKGRDLEPLETVYPGCVFGIGGDLHKLIYKSATLSTRSDIPAFDYGIPRDAPLIQVAVQPSVLADYEKIASGLKVLCQADPCAETFIRPESGEYVLAVAGELHLEQCLKDLKERFAKVDLVVSPPLVSFRETILGGASILLEEGLVISVERSEKEDNELVSPEKISLYRSAFSLAMKAGPLCQEPLQYVKIKIEVSDADAVGHLLSDFGAVSIIKAGIHNAFLNAKPRLALAMYSCAIQCSNETLGRVYSILNKRNARICGEEWSEASASSTVLSRLPVIESWGLTEEMRSRTSGMAFPQLVYCGFELLDEPPIPEEEEEELVKNNAMRYLKVIRQRKGLFVEREIVEEGEKQRTLKK